MKKNGSENRGNAAADNAANVGGSGNGSGQAVGESGKSGTTGGGNQSGDAGNQQPKFGHIGGVTLDAVGDDATQADGRGVGDGGSNGNGNSGDGDGRRNNGRPVGSRNKKRGVGGSNADGNDAGFTSVNVGSRNGNDGDSGTGQAFASRETGDSVKAVTDSEINDYQKTAKSVKTRGKKGSEKTDFVRVEKQIKKGAKLLFGLLATRGGEHWELEEEEAADLASDTVELLKSFPESQIAMLAEKAEKYAPAVSLTITAGIIVMPRIKQTINPKGNKKNEVFTKPIHQQADGNVHRRPERAANPVAARSATERASAAESRADVRDGAELGNDGQAVAEHFEASQSSIAAYSDFL